MFQWLKNLVYRRRVGALELLAEFPERAPPEPYPDGPRHLFVAVRGKGMCYVGLVASDHEATDQAQAVIGSVVMQTGEVTMAHYWTTTDLDRNEELAVVAAKRHAKS